MESSTVYTIMEEVHMKLASMKYKMKAGCARDTMEERWRVEILTEALKKKTVKWEKLPVGKLKIN